MGRRFDTVDWFFENRNPVLDDRPASFWRDFLRYGHCPCTYGVSDETRVCGRCKHPQRVWGGRSHFEHDTAYAHACEHAYKYGSLKFSFKYPHSRGVGGLCKFMSACLYWRSDN